MLKNSQELVCDKCGHNTFINSFMLRTVSKLLTGSSEDNLLPIPVFECSKCGHINEDFIPDFAKNKNKLTNPFE